MSEVHSDQIEAAVASADLRVLLMVMFHLTGDQKWLNAPFLPTRDVRLIADENAGLTESAQQVLRDAAIKLFSDAIPDPVIKDPGQELMVQMMRTCLGEKVPPEYAAMMREQIGFVARNDDIAKASPSERFDEMPVLIAGAGASGLALGASLLEKGIPFVIVEKKANVGGTWRENIYPGCAVDTPNHAYSFSFASPYPWSRYFSPRNELQDYLERCANEFGLSEHIRFQTSVTDATWNDAGGYWDVGLNTPEGSLQTRSVALVSAIGQLSLPSVPSFEGGEQFDGEMFHSALWPEDLDINGKHVAVIGTGASAMQIVPTIADQVESVTVYQRTAQWARPIERFHDAISESAQWLFDHVPYYAAWYRFTMLWRYGDGLLPTLRIDPDWTDPERSLNRVNDRHRQQMTDHITQVLGDRDDLLQQCLPTYPPYGKRILLDNHWFATLLKPNVHLVTNAPAKIDKAGITDSTGTQREADVIVLATGFQVGPMAARLNITGRNGVKLADAWADSDPTAYIGITVPQFPNFFCTQGPNTGLGHGGSAIFQAECQAHYITACLVQLSSANGATMEVKQAPHDEYMNRVDAEHEQMIWSHPGMGTYYRNAKGRVFSVMPWRLVDYWAMTRQPDMAHYDTQKFS